MILFQHQVRRNEQTERVCAAYASLIPIRRKAYVFSFFKFLDIEKKGTAPKNTNQSLRVNIVLNNKEDPMHDATDTCSCDCGVRATVQRIARVSGCVYRVMRS